MGDPPARAEAHSPCAEATVGRCPCRPLLSGAVEQRDTREEAQAGSRDGRGCPASLLPLLGRLVLEIGLVRMRSPNRLRRQSEVTARALVLRVSDLLTVERRTDGQVAIWPSES